MVQDIEKEIKKNKLAEIGNTLLRFYRIIAALLLICFIAGAILINWFILGLDNFNHQSLRIWESVESLLLHFMPILVVFLIIKPLTDIIDNIREENKSLALAKSLEPIHVELQNIIPIINKLNKFPEIESFEASYHNLNWKYLLDKSIEIDLCFFYTSSEWNQNNLTIFGSFLKRDGTLNLYLPNPLSISDQFFELSEIKIEIAEKIIRTANKFREEHNKIKRGTLNVKFLDKGFNYMYARVHKNKGKLFVYSPYQNLITNNQSPVITLNENNMPITLENFIDQEFATVKNTPDGLDFEKEKYIIWDESHNRVFVSDSLSCPANCKFCYIESIVDSERELHQNHLGGLIAKSIVTDKRFVLGENGTTILLGGFSDPFLPKNILITLEIITALSRFKNFIHVATRYGIGKNEEIKKILFKQTNIIVNYSFSCLDEKIELANFDSRFSEAKELIKNNVKVALYIRPVLPQITLSDTPEIINRAKGIGIQYVTVGGLYIDEKIKASLSEAKIIFNGLSESTKPFILDESKSLKKLTNNEVDKVFRSFAAAGFKTFSNSIELINHFRDRLK